MKNSKQLERHFKRLANHRRLDILLLISKTPGITVEGIAKQLHANFKTIAHHTKKLVHSGLVDKKYYGRAISHTLSPYRKQFISFIGTFSHS